jgi:thiamine-phosphate pyrophosphorylase
MTMPEGLSKQTLRIIDANLNRIGESLRLLEDIARLILNNAALSRQLKSMRHELEEVDFPLKKQLLQARQADSDVGADIKVEQQLEKRDLYTAVIANSRRIEQSLRVIEELGKGLYAIIDTDSLKGRSHLEIAREILKGGARIIQLRDKTTPKKELLPIAVALKKLCAEYDALFIVNDHLDIALATDADGLHIEQEGIPAAIARRLMPIDKIIGCSVSNQNEATAAETDGADYITVSSIYPITSKGDVKITGLDTLCSIKEKANVPVVASGGTTYDNISGVIPCGIDSIALISDIREAPSLQEATRKIIAKMGLNNE